METAARARWLRPSTGAMIVFLAAVAVYANTLRNGFVYDDLHQVLEDPRIRSIGGLGAILTSGVWSFKWGPSNYYRPMMQISYLLTYRLAELRPWAYHLVNVMLHAGATLALYALALRVLAARIAMPVGGALVAALVFAVHPLHTEAVAWIAAVGDLQLGLYGLVTIWLYLRALEGSHLAYAAALVFETLSLLSKEPAVVFAGLLFVVDLLWSRPASPRRALVRTLPFFALTAGYLAVRRIVLGGVAPPGLHTDIDSATDWMTAIVYLARYVSSCVWPFPLNALYEFRPITSPTDPRFLLSILLCGLVLAAVVRFRRDRRIVLAALLFSAPLLPALYIPGLGAGGLAERYMYLPLAGFGLAAGLVWMVLRERGPWIGRAATLLFGALLVTGAAASISRNTVWKDEETLWADTVLKSPRSAVAHESLGYGYFLHGKFEEAISENLRAIELDPRRATAWINLGAVYRALGRSREAAEAYGTALDQGSNLLEAHAGLGLALVDLGDYRGARRQLAMAVAIDPRYASVQDALGVACANLGEFAAAEASFEKAVAIDPATPGYREHLESARRDRTRTQPRSDH